MNKNRFYYRLRPMCDNTLEELQKSYLWFSKRQGFKDKYDANIGAFLEDTDQIYNSLRQFGIRKSHKKLVI